jgi:hypothetical protein
MTGRWLINFRWVFLQGWRVVVKVEVDWQSSDIFDKNQGEVGMNCEREGIVFLASGGSEAKEVSCSSGNRNLKT